MRLKHSFISQGWVLIIVSKTPVEMDVNSAVASEGFAMLNPLQKDWHIILETVTEENLFRVSWKSSLHCS